MQIEINKEVSDYKETVFFGLTLRQCVCSVLAIVVAVVLYFSLKPHLGSELLSWVCMLGAAPFAAMGFFHYHGMTAEQFALNWVRTVLLEPQCFPYHTDCTCKPTKIKKKRKEKAHVQDTQPIQEATETEV